MCCSWLSGSKSIMTVFLSFHTPEQSISVPPPSCPGGVFHPLHRPILTLQAGEENHRSRSSGYGHKHHTSTSRDTRHRQKAPPDGHPGKLVQTRMMEIHRNRRNSAFTANLAETDSKFSAVTESVRRNSAQAGTLIFSNF